MLTIIMDKAVDDFDSVYTTTEAGHRAFTDSEEGVVVSKLEGVAGTTVVTDSTTRPVCIPAGGF